MVALCVLGTLPPHISAAFTNVTRFNQRIANLSGSTYVIKYASPLRSLWPCWATF
jgi:hypothetical protein